MSREAYLKKYLSGSSSGGGGGDGDYDVAPAAKRKKKPVGVGPKALVARNAITGAAGLKIIDDSLEPDWRATAAANAGDDSAGTRRETFIDMRKRGHSGRDEDEADDPLQPTRYIQVERNDGSGWNSLDNAAPAAAARVDSDGDADMSPRRRAPAGRDADRSPPHRSRHDSPDRSPPRRARHDSPDRSPPRRARHDSPDASPPRRAPPAAAADRDASPPRRKRRHDSPDGRADRPPPRRSAARAASPDADRSPPRRRARHDSPEPADRSPPRRVRHDSPAADRSPPRRARHDSPDGDRSPPRRARHDSPDADRSPPRRARHDSPEPAAAASSSAVAAPAAAAQKKGLILAADFQERNQQAQEKARADLERIAALEGGTGAPATVVRDKSGKRISLEEYEAQLAAERAAKESKPMEWASGLAQQVAAARAAEELQAERGRAFARTADDAELNAAQKGMDRWGDPMLVAIRRAEAAAQAESLRAQQAAQERLLHKERKAARKEIRREKKELKRDKKKLLKQLDKQRRSEALDAGGMVPPEATKEEQEKLVAELLAAKAAQLAEKKAALKAQKEAVESKIALDLAAGGSGIVVSAAWLAGPSAPGTVVREPRPMYRGHPWPNRYGILPGYRWDGVVRGIGWEDRIVRTATNRAHAKARGWKMGSEDM